MEIENATENRYQITITLADRPFGEVGYKGQLGPGEVESLYLRPGFDYDFVLVDEARKEAARLRYGIWAYTNLVYDGTEIILGEETVEVPEESRVVFTPRNSLAPLYVGMVSSGFSVLSEGPSNYLFEVDKQPHLVVGLAGETRFLSDYLAWGANLGYSPENDAHGLLFATGPMVKFRPLEPVDPYLFFQFGVHVVIPNEQEVNDVTIQPSSFLNPAFDFGGGVLFGITDHFSINGEGRFHWVQLDPWYVDEKTGFDEEALFDAESALFPELRIGVRYAP